MPMPDHFFSYLFDVSAATPNMSNLIEEAFELATTFSSQPLRDILVADYFDGSARQIEELWFFSEKDALLVQNFAGKRPRDYRITVMAGEKQLQSFSLEAQQFDLVREIHNDPRGPQSTDASSLQVRFENTSGVAARSGLLD